VLIVLEERDSNRVAEAMDLLRWTGIHPKAGATSQEQGTKIGVIVLNREVDGIAAVQVLKENGFAARLSKSD
jgi:hypothetical protein